MGSEVGVLYDSGGVAKSVWFWPQGDRVCPLEIPSAPTTLVTGDIVVQLAPATVEDFEVVTQNRTTVLSLSALLAAYPSAEQLPIPTLPPATPTAPLFRYHPGYRRVVRVPESGGTVTTREQVDDDGVRRIHTSYEEREVVHVHVHGEPNPHGPHGD